MHPDRYCEICAVDDLQLDCLFLCPKDNLLELLADNAVYWVGIWKPPVDSYYQQEELVPLENPDLEDPLAYYLHAP